MNLRKFIFDGLNNANVEQSEISAEVNFIMRNFLNIKNPYLDEIKLENKQDELQNIFEKRKRGLPLQYILNKAEFMGEIFFVDENVLIPRPETEILVLKTLEKANQINASKILDIGTGSGCIAIMLKKNLPSTNISSCDISENALNVAKENSKNLNAEVNFIKSDLFENIQNKFDIIVSNPPYIPPKEKENIQREVSFEPDLALYTKDELGIEFYEKIIKQAKTHLNNGGFLLFELGINQSDIVKSLFIDYNYNEIEIIKDLDGIDRVISARIQNG